MDTILGLAGFLKSGLGLALELFFGKKILEFFKGGGIGFRILTSLGTSLISWLFSRLGLMRLAGGILPFLLPIIGFAIGKNLSDEFFSNQDPLKDFTFLDRMKDESKNVFPTNDRRAGGTPEKPMFQSGKTGKSLGFLGTSHASVYELNEETKNEIYDTKTGKRKPDLTLAEPYELQIPGLSESKILHLTHQQAKSWGNKREKFIELSEKYLTQKNQTTVVGNVEAENRRNEDLNNQLSKILELQNSMLDDVEKIAKDTLKTAPFERLKGQIERAKLQQYDSNLMSGLMGKVWKATGIEETVTREINDLENKGKVVAGSALNFMSEKNTDFQNAIRDSSNSARENILDQWKR
jgi:hypothetical protein